MQRLGLYASLLALAVAFTGCSQETQRKAGEALDQTGGALESAAKDTANVTKGVIKGASEAVEKNRAKPDTEPPK
jgi:predicted small secreted protein